MVYCPPDYPRPQFVRKDWKNLNGIWNFAFDDTGRGLQERWYEKKIGAGRITVPFTYETEKSGIGDQTPHCVVWYQRTLNFRSGESADKKEILRFEGCDYRTSLWVNGKFAGNHEGGYTRFSFDISDLLAEGENTLTVRVEDSLDKGQPRGKQSWTGKPFGCWYVQTTGIWKTVWLEPVPKDSLCAVKMTPDIGAGTLRADYTIDSPDCGSLELEAEISLEGNPVVRMKTSVSTCQGTLSIRIADGPQDIRLWTPESPNLYDIHFTLYRGGAKLDEVSSYFGMREVSIDGGNVLLNGQKLYQRLVLDQGYWPDTRLTPPDAEALKLDVERAKALGFNGARKHQKIEDERWLYWCDVKGLLVWSEAPAFYRLDDDSMESFTKQWMQMVKQNYNHPCVITWVPFNESWGLQNVKNDRGTQAFCEGICWLTKAFDPKRPVISNDGWEHTVSDILTLHDYHGDAKALREIYCGRKDEILHGEIYYNLRSAYAKGYGYSGQPVILSEIGGLAIAGPHKGWGYGREETDEEAFLAHYAQIIAAVRAIPYVSGYCYTQLTDVQQDVNGLMDENRVFKADPKVIRKVNEQTPAY